MTEYKTLDLLRAGLSSGSILPPNVRATKVVTQPSLVVGGQRIHADAIVEFLVLNSPHKPIQALIELKSRLTPMVLEGVVHHLLRDRNELHRLAEYQDLYPMVAAPYISDSIQTRCKQLGVGYIDLNGTFALIHHDVYVDIVRPATVFKNPQGVKNIFSGRSRRILR